MAKKFFIKSRVLIIIALVALFLVCATFAVFVFLENGNANVFLKSEKNTLEYMGKPINPDCLEKIVGMGYLVNYSESVNLKDCVTNNYEYKEEDGWLVVDYGRDEYGYNGFFQYKVLGKVEDKFVIASTENGGGTGYFQGIGLVKMDGYNLLLDRAIVYGDRCNGGVDFEKTKVEGKILYYSKKITPADVMDTIEGSQNPNGPNYPQLDYCAICCTGTSNYKYDITTGAENLISVSFQLEKFEPVSGQSIEQSCFDKTYNSYIDSGITEISKKELEIFGQKFLKCLGSK